MSFSVQLNFSSKAKTTLLPLQSLWNESAPLMNAHLIEPCDEVFYCVVVVILSGHDGGGQGGFQVWVAFVAIWASQVSGEKAEVVEGKYAAVQLLLLFCQDGGDFLRELDEVPQIG